MLTNIIIANNATTLTLALMTLNGNVFDLTAMGPPTPSASTIIISLVSPPPLLSSLPQLPPLLLLLREQRLRLQLLPPESPIAQPPVKQPSAVSELARGEWTRGFLLEVETWPGCRALTRNPLRGRGKRER